MDGEYASIFARNIGIVTPGEQERLRGASVAIAGVGGVGGLLAERLVRLGVGQMKLTDPGLFEPSNSNRQFAAGSASMGQKKVAAVLAQIGDINPQARIEASDAGIRTPEDAEDFVRGADLVVDEMDFGMFRESILLQRAARRQGIPYLFALAVAIGAMVVIFDPYGCTLEKYNGLADDVDVDDPAQLKVSQDRIGPAIPSYAWTALTREMAEQILAGKMPGPVTSIGAGLAALLAAGEVMNIILRRRAVAFAPCYTYIDLLDREFRVGTL